MVIHSEGSHDCKKERLAFLGYINEKEVHITKESVNKIQEIIKFKFLRHSNRK